MEKFTSGSLRLMVVLLVQLWVNLDVAQAQVIRDASVSTSVQTSNDTFEVTGGRRLGGNLFHSFREFSVPEGTSVIFRTPANIQTIISRVTGGSRSVIDGAIEAGGDASLVLLNPNGITFGRDASLALGGSFLATTADRVVFADGQSFSATASQAAPLLTLSTPVGLQFGSRPGQIINRSAFTPPNGSMPLGLQVQSGKTLALVGGDVSFEGGILFAPGGSIEVGSVSDQGSVTLISGETGWTLGYDATQARQDIHISDQSFLVTNGFSSGSVQLWGRQITITNGSNVLAFNVGADAGGDIVVNASELVLLDRNSGIRTQALVSGSAGNIMVMTPQLVLRRESDLDANASRGATGGGIFIDASQLIDVGSFSQITAQTFGTGDAGDISISTQRVSLSDGGQITSDTRDQGNGGNISINAMVSVEVNGRGTNSQNLLRNSGIQVQTESDATGNGGTISINTGQVLVTGGGQISVAAIEESQGHAGTLNINASESVFVSGPGSRLLAESSSSMPAGDLNLRTVILMIQEGGEISVQSSGTGAAGNLGIDASLIALDQGRLTASTQAGQGNIDLRVTEALLLAQDSRISTNALGTALGGNIRIGVPILVALGNSNITANAEQGLGGRITINTQGLFRTENSNITATSLLGPEFSGEVNINTPGEEPNEGLVPLPERPLRVAPVKRRCLHASTAAESRLVIISNGGPYTSTLPLVMEQSQAGLANPVRSQVQAQKTNDSFMGALRSVPIMPVEAQGWRLRQGRLHLVADLGSRRSNTAFLPQYRC